MPDRDQQRIWLSTNYVGIRGLGIAHGIKHEHPAGEFIRGFSRPRKPLNCFFATA
jgi:hypothetical protein